MSVAVKNTLNSFSDKKIFIFPSLTNFWKMPSTSFSFIKSKIISFVIKFKVPSFLINDLTKILMKTFEYTGRIILMLLEQANFSEYTLIVFTNSTLVDSISCAFFQINNFLKNGSPNLSSECFLKKEALFSIEDALSNNEIIFKVIKNPVEDKKKHFQIYKQDLFLSTLLIPSK